MLPADFALTEITFPQRMRFKQLEIARLPSGWDSESPGHVTQELGAEWIREGIDAVLSVPSTVIPTERNYVINPAHDDFAEIRFGVPVPFHFDSRLKK